MKSGFSCKQGVYFMGFTPAVSADASCSFRKKIRMVMKETLTTDLVLLSKVLNPIMNKLCES